MLFPTISKVRLRVEEYLVRFEMLDATIADFGKQLNVGSSIFGDLPALDELKARCVRAHATLNRALDGLYAKSVSPRELASRFPNVERELSQIEFIADQIRKSLAAMRTA